MTKKEKIKDAWGLYFNHFGEYATKHELEKNGYCSVPSITLGLILRKHGKNWLERNEEGKYRPKSLQGIEHNNGWVKIESEDDLPKENYIDVFVYQKDNKEPFILQYANSVFMSEYKNYNNITHYQPIEKPKPPLY